MPDIGKPAQVRIIPDETFSLRIERFSSIALCAFLFIFILIEIGPLRKTGSWLDELFTMWVSDPSIPFREILLNRILPDTNPPGYVLTVYGLRQYFSAVTAPIVINIIFLGASIAGVLITARRGQIFWLGCVAVCFFLISGPVLYYFAEARAYLCALSLTFAASWLVFQSAVTRNGTCSISVFAGLGILAALIHPYASLYCCSLAAASLCIALLEPNRSDLVKQSLALGVGAALTTSLTLIPIEDAVAKIDWIKFDWQHVSAAAIKSAALSLAPAWALLALGLIWGAYSKSPNLRIVSWLFAITYLCFVFLPIVISFKMPIIAGRYWTIGSPGLIVFTAFALRERLSSDLFSLEMHSLSMKSWALIALGGCILFSSVAVASYAKNAKPVWKGAEELKPLLADCASQSVKVANSYKSWPAGIVADGAFVPAFSYLTGKPEEVFVQVKENQTAKLQTRPSQCPVVGWAENLDPAVMLSSGDRELMNLLNIDDNLEDVEIHRQRTGFYVLRKAAPSGR
jgi:hypothetical protein